MLPVVCKRTEIFIERKLYFTTNEFGGL